MLRIIIISLLILMSYYSNSQELVTDRPDQTESAIVVPKGSLQIETGLVYETSNDEAIKNFAGPSTLLRYGISNIFELRMFNQYESNRIDLEGSKIKIKGLSDLEFGLKIQLLKKGNTNTDIAFLSHVVLPTAKDELSNMKTGTINRLCVSNQLTSNIALGYNIGYQYLNETDAFTHSITLAFPVIKIFGMYIENYGTLLEGGHFENNFDLGVTYLLADNFQLDLSYGFGLNNDMNYISTGLSWNISSFLKSKQ